MKTELISRRFADRERDFEQKLTAAESAVLKRLLRRAVKETRAAASALIALCEFSTDFASSVKRNVGELVAKSDALVINARELESNAEALLQRDDVDADAKVVLARIHHRALLSTNDVLESGIAECELTIATFKIAIRSHLDVLCERLLKPDYSEFIAESVHAAIMTVFNFIPIVDKVATVADIIQTIKDAARTQFKKADSYNKYLEQYAELTKLWCKVAYALIAIYKVYTIHRSGDSL
jgi:hypothetical protein